VVTVVVDDVVDEVVTPGDAAACAGTTIEWTTGRAQDFGRMLANAALAPMALSIGLRSGSSLIFIPQSTEQVTVAKLARQDNLFVTYGGRDGACGGACRLEGPPCARTVEIVIAEQCGLGLPSARSVRLRQ
jgi:hypothetical protein